MSGPLNLSTIAPKDREMIERLAAVCECSKDKAAWMLRRLDWALMFNADLGDWLDGRDGAAERLRRRVSETRLPGRETRRKFARWKAAGREAGIGEGSEADGRVP